MHWSFRALIIALVLVVGLGWLPSSAQAWTPGVGKSNTDPGIGNINVRNESSSDISSVGPGQNFVVSTQFLDPTLTSEGFTQVRRIHLLLRHNTTGEWVTVYLHRGAGGPPTLFTVWGYSPNAGTAVMADTDNPRAQRLSESDALAYNSTVSVNKPIVVAKGIPAINVVSVSLAPDQSRTGAFVVTWTLKWSTGGEGFAAGEVSIYASIEKERNYDGWDPGPTISFRNSVPSVSLSSGQTLPQFRVGTASNVNLTALDPDSDLKAVVMTFFNSTSRRWFTIEYLNDNTDGNVSVSGTSANWRYVDDQGKSFILNGAASDPINSDLIQFNTGPSNTTGGATNMTVQFNLTFKSPGVGRWEVSVRAVDFHLGDSQYRSVGTAQVST